MNEKEAEQKSSLGNEKLKVNRASETEGQRKERLRIRRENKKTENHKKQRLATLKRLKRGDDNELDRNLRLEKVVAIKQLRLAVKTEEERAQGWRMQLPNGSGVGHEDGGRKKSKTGEDGSYRTAHVSPD